MFGLWLISPLVFEGFFAKEGIIEGLKKFWDIKPLKKSKSFNVLRCQTSLLIFGGSMKGLVGFWKIFAVR